LKSFVVDTNVAVVANRQSPQASPHCVLACVDALQRIVKYEKILIDDKNLILQEYLHSLSLAGQPGMGNAFFKWLWDNQANIDKCEKIVIHPKNGREDTFTEFPNDPELARFDRSDRKFVAIAIASGRSPSILNAVDSDWWDYRAELKKHGVKIEFLCPSQFEGRC
jgi:hypothetical protein